MRALQSLQGGGTCLQEVPSLTLCFPKYLILSDPTHFVRGQLTRHHHSHFSPDKSESQKLSELPKGTNPYGPPCFCLSHHLCFFFSSPQFLSYQDKRINHGNLPHLQQRVRFAASDPSQYDASINLMNLQVSDTATYECRVKKTTMATRKVIVTVQGMASLLWAPLPQTSESRVVWTFCMWLCLWLSLSHNYLLLCSSACSAHVLD